MNPLSKVVAGALKLIYKQIEDYYSKTQNTFCVKIF